MKKNGWFTLLVGISIVFILALLPYLGACARAPAPTPKSSPSPAAPASTPAPAPKTSPTPSLEPKPTSAVSAADFYKNNVLTVLCPMAAGGGNDYAARLFATFWSDVTDGSARVKNVTGAGGQAGINQAAALKQDGLTIVTISVGALVLLPTLTKEVGVKYDAKKFTWLGTLPLEGSVLAVSAKSPYKSVADLQKGQGLKFASTSKYAAPSVAGAITIEALGLKGASIVAGFAGTADCALSVGKGESDVLLFSPPGTTTYVQRGLVKSPLLTVGTSKSKWFPDAPALSEVVKLTAEQEMLLGIVANIQQGGFGFFFAGEGVPQDRVEFIRDAFIKLTKLAAFKQMYALQWSVWEDAIPGKDLEAKVKSALGTKNEDIAKLIKLVDTYAR